MSELSSTQNAQTPSYFRKWFHWKNMCDDGLPRKQSASTTQSHLKFSPWLQCFLPKEFHSFSAFRTKFQVFLSHPPHHWFSIYPKHWHPSQLPKCLLTFFKFLSNTDFHLPKSTKLQSPSPSLQRLQFSSTQITLSNVRQIGLLSRHSKHSAQYF